jgi:hypothetical protein
LRALARKRTMIIGVVVHDLTNPFVPGIASGISDEARQRGYTMMLLDTLWQMEYEAKSTDVEVEWLERAASLLVLRRETLWIIDGAGPSIEVSQLQPNREEPERANETEPQQETGQANGQQSTTKTAQELAQTSTSPNRTFSGGLVPIDLKRFTDSGISLVECPDCRRMRSLSPVKGVLRFRPHTRRKQQTPLTEKRWSSSGKTGWDVVGG